MTSIDADCEGDKLLPPPQFLDTAQRVAQALSLDLQRVIDGCPITYQDIDFWLMHHGSDDPNGMVVMVEVGRLEPKTEAKVLRALMEYHYVAPAGVIGYCAIMPGSDLLAFCVRIDFDRTPNPAGAVFDFVKSMVEKRETLMLQMQMQGNTAQEGGALTWPQ